MARTLRVLLCGFRQLLDRLLQRLTHLLHPQHLVGNGPCAARILDVLLPARHLHHVVGQRGPWPTRDRPGMSACQPRLAGQHARERRVRNHAAVPVVLAFDFDGGEARRQRAGSHEMLRPQPALGRCRNRSRLPVRTLTAPTLTRISPEFRRSKSTSRSSVLVQRRRVVEAGRGSRPRTATRAAAGSAA